MHIFPLLIPNVVNHTKEMVHKQMENVRGYSRSAFLSKERDTLYRAQTVHKGTVVEGKV